MSFFRKIAEWFEHLVEHDDYYTVTVKRGDNLSNIYKALTGEEATEDEIKRIVAANPNKQWTNDYVIYPGEVLKVPKE